MSFKSMESVLNLFNNKPLKTQYSKESIIYSTELVNDMRKLVKYDAFSREFDDTLGRISEEIDMTIHSIESFFYNMERKYTIGKSLQKEFSAEMFDFYARSLEKIDIKETAKNIGKTVQEACKRIIAFFWGLIKKLEAFVKRLFIGQFSKTFDKFKAEDFTNVNAEVKVHKLASNLSINNFGYDLNEADKAFGLFGKDASDDSLAGKNAYESNREKLIYKKYFGTEEKPKAETMTVATFLNASSGQKPALLDLLSKKGVEKVKEGQKVFKKSIDHVKTLQKEIININKEHPINDNDYSKNKIKTAKSKIAILNLMQKMSSTEFTCIFTVLADINKAVNAGLKKAKEEKKSK